MTTARALAPLASTTVVLLALAARPAAASVWQPGNLMLQAEHPFNGAHLGRSVVAYPSNDDNRDDLAVGAPDAGDGVGEVDIYSARPGRTFSGATALTHPGLVGGCHLGAALAVGHFDTDRHAPGPVAPFSAGLVIGTPDCDGGLVSVFVTSVGMTDIRQGDISGNPSEDGDRFGAAFAVGDFNGDGYDDLAVGAPGEDLSIGDDVGIVHVVYGGPDGLDIDTGQTFSSVSFGDAAAAAGDDMGAALAAGDFDGDGYTDLAIGIPGRLAGGHPEAGAVRIAFGGPGGIVTADSQLLDEGPFGGQQALAHFGATLAAGDFNEDDVSCAALLTHCADDLAIGVPDEDIGAHGNTGKVVVAFGGKGLSTTGAQILHESVLNAFDETGDHFGGALAAGRQDSRDPGNNAHWAADLAIGDADEDDFGLTDDGAFFLLAGGPSKLDMLHAQQFDQIPPLASAPASTNDRMGSALSIGDFDGDGVGDLAIGIPGHAAANKPSAGVVLILYGGLMADGFESGTMLLWSASTP